MLPSVNKINVEKLRDPFFIYKPKNLKKSVNYFTKNFSGEVLYAVKANPSEFILKKIYELGIRSFDAASIAKDLGADLSTVADSIVAAANVGVSTDLEAAAQGLGYSSFADAVRAYNEKYGTNYTEESAREALGQ